MSVGGGSGGWVPVAACALPTAQQPLRLAESDRFFSTAVQRWARPGPTELELVIASQSEVSAREFAERETQCCSFFTFGFGAIDNGVLMHIAVPGPHIEVLDALQARLSDLVGPSVVNDHA